MNEGTMNSMYDEVSEIRNLNRVEGFDPRKYMRTIPGDNGTVKYYLDVAFRKLWFRLKYPEGKIVKRLLKLTEQVAIVEARVYLHRNDGEESFISNALAQKYFSTEDPFGNKYVEFAETAAVGRALSDAGFGLQFADKDDETDPQVTEAPFEANLLFPEGGLPEGTYMDMDSAGEQIESFPEEETTLLQEDEIPGQYEIGDYAEMAGESISEGTPAMQQNRQPVKPTVQTTKQNIAATSHPAAGKTKKQPAPEIRRDMPVEQIYQMLNRDMAASVVVPVGNYKNKTLGQVAVERPGSLEWYVKSYGGPDNLLRAAAKFLMETALQQAG